MCPNSRKWMQLAGAKKLPNLFFGGWAIKLLLRSESVRTAEEEFCFLDREPQEQHGQAVNAKTKATVRGTPVAEELEIEL